MEPGTNFKDVVDERAGSLYPEGTQKMGGLDPAA
jgi:hypothetical protein